MWPTPSQFSTSAKVFERDSLKLPNLRRSLPSHLQHLSLSFHSLQCVKSQLPLPQPALAVLKLPQVWHFRYFVSCIAPKLENLKICLVPIGIFYPAQAFIRFCIAMFYQYWGTWLASCVSCVGLGVSSPDLSLIFALSSRSSLIKSSEF